MRTIDEAYNSASGLYWIAFLLTGDKELSLRLVVNALDSKEGLDCIATTPARALLRRAVIRNCLAASQTEMSASIQRFAARQTEDGSMTIESSSSDVTISEAQMEEALLLIDLFPRCALLLTVFEGLPPQEAGDLLHSRRDLVEAARIEALSYFTRNLRSSTRPAVSTPASLQRVIQPTRLRVSQPSRLA